MNKSILTTHQVKNFSREFYQDGILCKLIVNIRYDDRCGNGHNTFAITADLYDRCHKTSEPTTELSTGKHRWLGSCGCLHDVIKKVYPELTKYIKWHLVSVVVADFKARLPGIMEEFKAAIEELDFTY